MAGVDDEVWRGSLRGTLRGSWGGRLALAHARGGSKHCAFAHELRQVLVDDSVAVLDGVVAREDVFGIADVLLVCREFAS